MDTVRLGLQMRALRIRKSLRQSDVAPLAKLSRTKVSRIERGQVAGMPISDLERAATALGAVIEVRLRWRGEQLDRLLDEGHARLVDIVVGFLRATGWEIAVEVSYSIFGERGSIDVLAYHRLTGIVLVVEVKSVVPDNQAMLHAMDRKTRLARQIAMDRGWTCRHVARLLVIGASPTARRRIHRLASTYDAAFPARGQAVRGWLSGPKDSISGLLFVSYAHGSRTRARGAGRQRVRRPRDPEKRTT